VIFVDGTTRQICEDARGQHVLDDDGQHVYGVWFVPEEQVSLEKAGVVLRLRQERCGLLIIPPQARAVWSRNPCTLCDVQETLVS
jgi:hypothetical protein